MSELEEYILGIVKGKSIKTFAMTITTTATSGVIDIGSMDMHVTSFRIRNVAATSINLYNTGAGGSSANRWVLAAATTFEFDHKTPWIRRRDRIEWTASGAVDLMMIIEYLD